MTTKDKIIKHFVGESGKIKSFYLQPKQIEKFPEIVAAVNELLPRGDLDFSTKVKMIIQNDGDLCRGCGVVHLHDVGNWLNPFTCRGCNVKEGAEKRKKTTKEKFGVEHASQSKEIKEKVKQSNRKRFGTDYAAQSDEVMAKMAETNKARYGVENPMQNEDIRAKSVENKMRNKESKNEN